MNILILKLGATGDVVRTTPLLKQLAGRLTWITAAKNVPLLENLAGNLDALSWERRHLAVDTTYDLVINLEDTVEPAQFAQSLKFGQLFGAFLKPDGQLAYSDDSRGWFDLSLISRFGKAEADRLKLENRRTYQEMIFDGLGFQFHGETYLLPETGRDGFVGRRRHRGGGRPGVADEELGLLR